MNKEIQQDLQAEEKKLKLSSKLNVHRREFL